MTAVGADVAAVDPFLLEEMTVTRSLFPTSAPVTV
jgi:hypothetical protein